MAITFIQSVVLTTIMSDIAVGTVIGFISAFAIVVLRKD